MKWSKFAQVDGDEFVGGDWNAIDDATGFKVKASQMKKQWDGHRTTIPLTRNPQDFLRAHQETIRTPWSRPEPDDNFGQTSADDL